MFGFYGLGFVFYSSRFPESVWYVDSIKVRSCKNFVDGSLIEWTMLLDICLSLCVCRLCAYFQARAVQLFPFEPSNLACVRVRGCVCVVPKRDDQQENCRFCHLRRDL